MIVSDFYRLFRYLFFAVFLSMISILAMVFHTSCDITPEGIKMISGEYECPQLTSYRITGSDSLEAVFSKDVKVNRAVVSALKEGEDPTIDVSCGETSPLLCSPIVNGKKVNYHFSGNTEIGRRYQLYSEITDDSGNTLSLAIPFYGYNSCVPVLIVTKVAPNTSSWKYVELTAMTEGNLYGLELCLSYNKIVYQLPDVWVKRGEKITVHFKYEGEGTDELTGNLNESTLKNAGSGRDLYFYDLDKKNTVSGSGDAVYVVDKNSGTILDGFMYCKANDKTGEYRWSRDAVKQNAVKIVNAGVWEGDGTENDAFTFSGTKKCLYRTESSILKIEALLKSSDYGGIICSSKEDWNY